MDDFAHAGVHTDEQVAGGLQGQLRRGHHAPLVHLGVGFGGPQAAFGDLQVLDNLGYHLLRLLLSRRSQRLGHQRRQAQHELALGDVLGDHLVAGVQVAVGGLLQVVAQLHVAQQEHVFPRHEYVVEEGHGIQLLEAGAQRVVEVGLPVVEALAALVAQSRRIVGDGESEGVRLGGLAGKLVRRGGIQRDLLGQRGQRGQHPGAVDVYPGVGFLLDP